MPSRWFRLGVCVVFWWLAPPTSPFSHGASRASCQDMSPGHIRAHPQDPHNSHVTLRTSHSRYRPGQLLTVTVRSSRDFMGFLLQARSGGGSGVQTTTTGTKARPGSARLGPILMGGAWTLTPPGTHTLRCLSEGDTLTHSDKQLKRNLSFVWRAPDVPMGDVRFYITVVQSYFVYWAGIGSAVVRDGTRRPWSGLRTPGGDGERWASNITATPAPNPPTTLNQQTDGQSSRPETTTSNEAPSDTPLRDVVKMRTSPSPADQVVSTTAPSGLFSEVTDDSASGIPDGHSEDPEGVRTTSDPPPLLNSLVSSTHGRNLEKLESKVNFYDSSTPVVLEDKVTVLNQRDTDPSLHSGDQTDPYTRLTPRTSEINPAVFPFLTSTDRAALQTSADGIDVGQLPQPAIDSPELPTEKKPYGPTDKQKQSPDTFTSSTQLPSTSRFQHTLNADTQDVPHQRNQSQQEIRALSSDSQPQFQLQSRTTWSFQWRTSQPSVTPRLLDLLQASSLQTAFTPDEGQDLPAETIPIRPISPPDITQRPHVTFLGPLATLPSFTSPRYLPGGSSSASQQSFRTTLSQDSTSSSATIHPITPPVLYTLPPANPISTPPQTSHVLHSSTSPSTTPGPRSSSFPSSELALVSTFVWSSPQYDPRSTLPSSSTTISPTLVSSVSPDMATSTSKGSSSVSISSSSMSPPSSPPHPGASPAPRQSLFDPLTSSIPPFPSQTPTGGQIQTRATPKGPEKNGIPSTPQTRVHPNPRPHPNSDPNFKIKSGKEVKPKPPRTEIQPKRPTGPAEAPEREGKYPGVVPSHRAWELVMLLACSAGLGMVMVVGVRCLYRQACRKHTRVTLNDRERDYDRGERGLIHVQECGDLVRVRRIRDNSFVLLAEYDILAAPGE